MARPEAYAWQLLRPHLLAAKLDPIRVENAVHPGTPDLNLATGVWIELKAIAGWPARQQTLVRLTKYTPQQRVWLLRRWRAGGGAWLALYVASCRLWYLFDGEAAQTIGKVPQFELVNAARLIGTHEQVAVFFAEREAGFRSRSEQRSAAAARSPSGESSARLGAGAPRPEVTRPAEGRPVP